MILFVIMGMLITPILGMPLLIIELNYSKRKINPWCAVPFALIYGMIGFSLYPISATDLTRYYDMVNGMRNHSLRYVFSVNRDMLYTRDILFWFVSRTGDCRVLAFLVGFFCYLIIFYMFIDTVNRSRVFLRDKGRLYVLLIGLVMISITSPYSIIGNVRCVFSFVMISFAYYREVIQQKKTWFTYVLYIIPIGLHQAAVVILAVRIFVPYLKRFSKVILIGSVLLPSLIRLAYMVASKISSGNVVWRIINNAVRRAYFYLNWSKGGWADDVKNSLSDRLTRGYGLFFLLAMIIFYFVCNGTLVIERCQGIEKCRGTEKFKDYLYVVAIISLGCLSIVTGAFWRFETIVVVCCPIILVEVLKKGKNNSGYLLGGLFVSSGAMFVLNSIHFMRNIEMGQFVLGFLTTSPFYVLFKIVFGFFHLGGKG